MNARRPPFGLDAGSHDRAARSETPARQERQGLRWARTSAALYALWSVLHLGAAASVWRLAAAGPSGLVQGRLQQNAWHLAMIALIALWIAWTRNRVNDRGGFRLNAALVGLTDVGFVALLLVPGHVPLVPGIVGPLVWLGALGSGALALRAGTGPGRSAIETWRS